MIKKCLSFLTFDPKEAHSRFMFLWEQKLRERRYLTLHARVCQYAAKQYHITQGLDALFSEVLTVRNQWELASVH